MSPETKRSGRPPKGAEAKRASFNTRLSAGVKAALEQAAHDAGRSLSEEIEFRLVQSLRCEPLAELIGRLEEFAKSLVSDDQSRWEVRVSSRGKGKTCSSWMIPHPSADGVSDEY